MSEHIYRDNGKSNFLPTNGQINIPTARTSGSVSW